MQTYDDSELTKFVTNPRYREKVIRRIHKTQDKEYNDRVSSVQNELDNLVSWRDGEINRIVSSNYEKLFDGKIIVHNDTGNVEINGASYPFSSIRGSNINEVMTARTVVSSVSDTRHNRKPSLGRAVVGATLFGPAGAVVGGALGKKKEHTTTTQYSNEVPVCAHLGVVVNIDGFETEIPLITSVIDTDGKKYKKAYDEAQQITAKLHEIASTKVPETPLLPQNAPSVIQANEQINEKQEELQQVIADKPKYEIPQEYRASEYDGLDDESYLRKLDELNSMNNIAYGSQPVGPMNPPMQTPQQYQQQQQMLQHQQSQQAIHHRRSHNQFLSKWFSNR